MSAAVIAALATAIPAVLGAITALVIALKSKSTANAAHAAVQDHIINTDKLSLYDRYLKLLLFRPRSITIGA